MKDAPLIVLLTDFGLKDNYVGVLKGIFLSHFPNAKIVDLTHDVPPQNIRFGAYQLLTSYTRFPEGALFLGVVDPGVGSKRKILYAEAAQRKFVAPDNGLLSWIFHESPPTCLFDISEAKLGEPVSQTFHARDIMAPVAAQILLGDQPQKWGKQITTWEKFSMPTLQKMGSQWEGEVLVVDSFGNLITNVPAKDVSGMAHSSTIWIELGSSAPPIRGLVSSYSQGEKGKLLAIAGSSGFVEISVRDGDAHQKTGLKEGDKVTFQFRV